jgi:tRNA threonylcarbamoyladenosine biosynthesis protein TsaE
MITLQSRSPEQTIDIGRQIGNQLSPGSIVTLSGTLGAGKTWLAKGIAYGLGVPDYEYMNSPAYDLIHEYRGRVPVFHLDLYRLTGLLLDDELMVQEVLSQAGVCLIEWPERLAPYPTLAPAHHLSIRIELVDEDEHLRLIHLAARGDTRYDALMQGFVAANQ